MISIFEITSSMDNVIMLYATPDDIAGQREALKKWYDARKREIPEECELAKAVLESRDDVLAKSNIPRAVEGRRLAAVIIEKYGAQAAKQCAEMITMAEALAADMALMKTYWERSTEIDALARRSATMRFAETPCLVPPQPAGLH